MSKSNPPSATPTLLRFVVPNLASLQTQLAQVATARPADAPTQPHWELFLDTPDLYLLRHGYTLSVTPQAENWQVRLADQQPLLHGKLIALARPRLTGEAHLASLKEAHRPQRWPKALATLGTALAPCPKLMPLLLLQRSSQAWTICAAPRVGPVTVDTVAIYPGDRDEFWPDATEHPLAQFGEVTLLPPRGKAKQGQAQLQRMAPFAELTPIAASTLHHALTLRSSYPLENGAERAGVQPTMPVAEACRLLLHTQLIAIVSNEAGVRLSQEMEYVHEMRVAIRRARAALKLYGAFFKPKATRALRKLLRATAQQLGQVRDLDVALAKARRKGDGLSTRKKAHKALLAEWQAQRAVAYDALLTWLDSRAYRTFVADFYDFCTTPGYGVKSYHTAASEAPPPTQVRHVMPSLLMARFEQVRAYEAHLETAAVVDYATIHTLRIECKYLRYSLEFVRHLLGAEGEALIDRLKALQDLLGDLNDAVVAKELMAGQADRLGAAALAHQQATIAELSQAVPAALADFVALENRQRFGQAVAKL